MALIQYTSVYAALLLCLLTSVSALKTQVLSTFIYTRYGDRTPLVTNNYPTLTPLGAQQLYQAGAWMRTRYIATTGPQPGPTQPSTAIRFISPTTLVNSQLNILSTSDQWIAASAQAFLQGLYPPYLNGNNVTAFDGDITLANGTVMGAPLNGIQYPTIRTTSSNDPRSIYLQGMTNCPAYTSALTNYYNTPQYQNLFHSSQSYYDSLRYKYLAYAFDNSSINFSNAYAIWDYLSYVYAHEETVYDSLSRSDYSQARTYASDLVFGAFANTSSEGIASTDRTEAIAGRTLAYRILQLFYNSINSAGQTNMMNLMFGSFEPMVSFAALAGILTPQNSAFYTIPAAGSSLVFELFSMVSDNATDAYPSTSDMYVRFLYMNGTDDNYWATLKEYPLFGSSPSQAVMSLSDFGNSMTKIAVGGVQDWCNICGSGASFCAVYDTSSSPSAKKSGLSPAVSGVIGAIVALAVALLLAGLFMLFGGFRVRRVERKRKSELGGFKGAEKLRSDQDLTLPKGGADAVVTETVPNKNHGHERVGSWELREQSKDVESQVPGLTVKNDEARLRKLEDDEISVNPYSVPVKPKDQF